MTNRIFFILYFLSVYFGVNLYACDHVPNKPHRFGLLVSKDSGKRFHKNEMLNKHRRVRLLPVKIISFDNFVRNNRLKIKEKKMAMAENILRNIFFNKYDPIGYVFKKYINHKLSTLFGLGSLEKAIQYLLKMGADVVRVPDYVDSKFCFRGASFQTFPYITEEQLLALNNNMFVDQDSLGKFENIPKESVFKISSYLDEQSFKNFWQTNKSMKNLLLGSDCYMPPLVIDRRLLNLRPWHLIEAGQEREAKELIGILWDLTEKYPNHGIAINFQGFNPPIDHELIMQLKQFPIVALHFRENKFPNGISELLNLCQLRELFAKKCNIKVFPRELCRLKELVALNLSHNEIEEIPGDIKKLGRLCFLKLSDNRIKFINPEVCTLSALRLLHLGNNRLTDIPKEISVLKQLRLLKFLNQPRKNSKNLLKTLPDSIGELGNLKKLSVHGCDLVSLPSSIGNLKKLKELYASCNSISKLPDEMGNLLKLQTLALWNNKLETIPENS